MIVKLDGYDVEIDDDIVGSIIELNNKGYTTFTCCSGHNTKESFYGYICFKNKLIRKYREPLGWGRDCDILPEYDEQRYWKQSKRTIRYFMDEKCDKEKTIKIMMKNLKIWVDGLEKIN